MDPFEHYQRAANPPRPDNDPRKTYTQFRRGDASFFILDTRTYRSTPPAKADGGAGSRSMLGAEQLTELLRWINSEKGWKVVVSGVPMTRVNIFEGLFLDHSDHQIELERGRG
jgi:alkaline phosphatase D